jgi:hypothetical protein
MASDGIFTKLCNQEGCNEPARWVNSKQPRYSKGGYYAAKCQTCSNLLSQYGINRTERDGIIAEQDNKCLICEKNIEFSGVQNCSQEKQAVVDHCHTTGKVRGILCAKCNIDLGYYEALKNKLELFENYLKEYGHGG